MAVVVTRACVSVKDKACVSACPVEAFFEGRDQLYINPDTCICCNACVPVCPVNAIFDECDVPSEYSGDVERNARVFTESHIPGCTCGYCDPSSQHAIGELPVAQPA